MTGGTWLPLITPYNPVTGRKQLSEDLAKLLLERVPGAAHAKLDYGVATVTWPGGTAASSLVAVTHNLGVVPVVVLATVASTGSTFYPAIGAVLYTATQFTLNGQTVDGQLPANGTTFTAAWLAIG